MSLENFIATLMALLLSNAAVIGWVVRESFRRADSTTTKLIDHLERQSVLLISNNEAQRREALEVNTALQGLMEKQRAEGQAVGVALREALERQRIEDREALHEHTEASKEIYRGMQEILAQLQSMNGKERIQ